MKPGPVLAAKELLEVIQIDSPPRDIEDWLTELVLSKGWRTHPADAREVAESWKKHTLKRLAEIRNEYIQLGRPPKFEFNSSSPYMVQGASYLEGTEPPDVAEAKMRRAWMSTYQSTIASLAPRDFEYLCKGLLDLLQVDDATVTPATADDGIDFYGRLRLQKFVFAEDVFPSIQAQLTVWLVGQAKRYKATQVATPDIRDLVGATFLARGQAFGSGAPDKYANLKIRPCDPVFSIFVTTGQISTAGWVLLRRSGVIGMDGELLAAFLADRGVGVRNGQFHADEFHNWIGDLKRSCMRRHA